MFKLSPFKRLAKYNGLLAIVLVVVASPFAYKAIHSYVQPHSDAVPNSGPITPLLGRVSNGQGTASAASSSSSAQVPQTKTKSLSISTGSSQPSSTAPTCTKDTTYAKANAISISYTSPGLKQVIDPVHYYKVYGYTPEQIRTQLNQCSPAQDGGTTFDASTDWWINYAYNVYTKTGGLCAINSAAVGLHITQAFPAWQSSQYDSSGLAQRWSIYTTNLTTHEQGHVNLDVQAANNFLAGLQNFPDTDCSNIYSSVNAYANGQFGNLNQANASYDGQTSHGATQGATFP